MLVRQWEVQRMREREDHHREQRRRQQRLRRQTEGRGGEQGMPKPETVTVAADGLGGRGGRGRGPHGDGGSTTNSSVTPPQLQHDAEGPDLIAKLQDKYVSHHLQRRQQTSSPKGSWEGSPLAQAMEQRGGSVNQQQAEATATAAAGQQQRQIDKAGGGGVPRHVKGEETNIPGGWPTPGSAATQRVKLHPIPGV